MHISPDRIREVIGSGGKVIQKIVADTGCKIDINDDGSIFISAPNPDSCAAAKKCIDDIVFEPEVGTLYYGRVVRLMTFGAFVELAPGKDGLVHISKLADHRIEKVEDACKIGDMPLSLQLEGQSFQNYLDGRDIAFGDFYARIRAGSQSTTSAVSVGDFEARMREVLVSGRDVLCINFSSALSTTYQSAAIAADDLRSEFPEAKLLVVDSLCASLGLGLLLFLCAQEKKLGRTIDEVHTFAQMTRGHICHWFTVDDLNHLKRGGRISAATALFGTMSSDAYALQRKAGFFGEGAVYLKGLLGSASLAADMSWDSGQLDTIVKKLAADFSYGPEETSYELGDGCVLVTKAKDGQTVSEEDLKTALNTVLTVTGSTSVTVPATAQPAAVLSAQEIHDTVAGQMKNAGYDPVTKSITAEQTGAEFDVTEAEKLLQDAEPGSVVKIPATIEQPAVTAEQLKGVLFRDQLGSATTHAAGRRLCGFQDGRDSQRLPRGPHRRRRAHGGQHRGRAVQGAGLRRGAAGADQAVSGRGRQSAERGQRAEAGGIPAAAEAGRPERQ